MLKFSVITIFPEIFTEPSLGGLLSYSVTGRALEKKLWDLEVFNLRDFANDTRKTIDGKPYAGGAGMVILPEILGQSIDHVVEKSTIKPKIFYPSPRGELFSQKKAVEISEMQHVMFICGRYEGIDQRVIDEYDVEEISLGDFVLSCGEIPAISMMDASIRHLEGALGDSTSLNQESFSENWGQGQLLEFPNYTKPANWRNREVPEVLMSGNHAEIEKFKLLKSEEITKERRPDLWQKYNKT